MNRDILRGKWNQLKGDVRKRWGNLTNDDLDVIQGDAEKFIGKLQERYGWGREQAEREMDDYLNSTEPRTGPQRRVS